jgi:hypothetical protein
MGKVRCDRWVAVFLWCAVAPPALAANVWTVNSTSDPVSGAAANCAPANVGTCTLRDALAAAATNGDTIHFSVGDSQTITLTSSTTLTIAHNTMIDASGSAGLTVDGNHAVTVFTIPAGVTASILHLEIDNGSAANVGGGINNAGALTLNDCTLSGNSAGLAGAIWNNTSATLLISGSLFIGNSAAAYGGAIFSQGFADVTDSAFLLNTAGTSGGAFYNGFSSSGTIRTSTLKQNSAQGGGGALVNVTDLTILQSTIYLNMAPTGGAIINTENATLSIANSTLAQNTATTQAGGIDNQGTLTLTNDTFAGNVSPYGVDLLLDFTVFITYPTRADNTIFGGSCAIGGGGGQVTGSNSLDAGTGCGLSPGNSNAVLNLGPLVDNGGVGGKTMLPGFGSKAIDFGNDAICAADPVNGVDERGIARPVGPHCDAGAAEVSIRRYVKADATGANNGTSWVDAYTSLQTALAAPKVNELWVARGTYKPTATSNRAVSFKIPPYIAVYGGFAGIDSMRDPAVYRTILSGDIDNNDTGPGGVDANASQVVGNNSYHVVTLDGTTAAGKILASTILDGFTITGGAATGGSPDDSGGGILCNGSGAGHECSPSFSNLNISGNLAGYVGGGLFNNGSSGGVASPLVTGTTFSGNFASNGGAVYNFVGNQSQQTYANVTFSGNHATAYGGAVYDYANSGSPAVTMSNVTFSGNQGDVGAGALAEYSCDGGAVLTSTMTNAILWGDLKLGGTEEIVHVCSALTFKNSVIQGSGGSGAWIATFGTNGGANLDADAKLGPLQDNGGSTPTMMPGSGTSTGDVGLSGTCAAAPVNALDQRGIHRPIGLGCDIGAVEATLLSLEVSDYLSFGRYGDTITYVVMLHNTNALLPVTGVHVTGGGSAALDDAGAQFVYFGSCTDSCIGTGVPGPLDDTVSILANQTVKWYVFVPVIGTSNAATATFTVHANGAAAVSDTDTLTLFRSGFESL